MPIHDWTRVEAGIFHPHHTCWIPEIQAALNGGLLPSGFYALSEQHAGQTIADVLTLHASQTSSGPPPLQIPTNGGGGTAVAEAPPRVSRKRTFEPTAVQLRRSLAIRHISGHRLIALLEIVSPANKDRSASVDTFAEKIVSALDSGVHVLLVELFPPGLHDPQGMHGVIRHYAEGSDEPYDLPTDQPLTLASYAAGTPIDIYLEHTSVGSVQPEMPLFLRHGHYINVPLEATYQAAYRGMPAFWKQVLEGASASNGPE